MRFSQLQFSDPVSKLERSQRLDLAMLHAVIGDAGQHFQKQQLPRQIDEWNLDMIDVPASSGVRIWIFCEAISNPRVDEGTAEGVSALRNKKDIFTTFDDEVGEGALPVEISFEN